MQLLFLKLKDLSNYLSFAHTENPQVVQKVSIRIIAAKEVDVSWGFGKMVLIFEGDVGITIWIHSHKIEDWFTNGLVTDWVQLCDLHPTYHRSVFMKPSWFKRKSNYITTCYLKSSTGANQAAYKESNFDLSNSPVSAAAAWLVRFDILKPSPSEKLAGTHRTETPGGFCDQNRNQQ